MREPISAIPAVDQGLLESAVDRLTANLIVMQADQRTMNLLKNVHDIVHQMRAHLLEQELQRAIERSMNEREQCAKTGGEQ